MLIDSSPQLLFHLCHQQRVRLTPFGESEILFKTRQRTYYGNARDYEGCGSQNARGFLGRLFLALLSIPPRLCDFNP
jgi:hypothetical protein